MGTSEQAEASKEIDPGWVLLRRVETTKLETLAAGALTDIATLSRFANNKGGLTAAQLGRLLSAVGLKLVDADRHCVRIEELDMLRRVYAIVVQQAPHLLEVDES